MAGVICPSAIKTDLSPEVLPPSSMHPAHLSARWECGED